MAASCNFHINDIFEKHLLLYRVHIRLLKLLEVFDDLRFVLLVKLGPKELNNLIREECLAFLFIVFVEYCIVLQPDVISMFVQSALRTRRQLLFVNDAVRAEQH